MDKLPNPFQDLLSGLDPEPVKIGDDVFVPMVAGGSEMMFVYVKYEDLRDQMDYGDSSGDFRLK